MPAAGNQLNSDNHFVSMDLAAENSQKKRGWRDPLLSWEALDWCPGGKEHPVRLAPANYRNNRVRVSGTASAFSGQIYDLLFATQKFVSCSESWGTSRPALLDVFAHEAH